MNTAIKFGLVGFLAGVCAALALTAISADRVISANEMHVLWPAAVVGVDFSGWADGNAWHFFQLMFLYLGNGLIYALAACCFGGLVELLRRS